MKKRIVSIVLACLMVFSLACLQAGAAGTWYDAYKDFVVNEKYLNYSGATYVNYNPFVDLDMYRSFGNGLEHSLYDINKDGVPELIICQPGWTIGGTNNNIFSYQNGQIIFLGAVNGPTVAYDTGGQYPGLFIALHHSYGEADYLTMQNGRLKITAIVTYDMGNDEVVTNDKKLYQTWLAIEKKCEQGNGNVPTTLLDEIKKKGWDAFVAKYGFSKPAPVHTHNLKQVSAVAATCTKNGNTAYWMCSGCGKYYADANGKKETSLSAVTVKALGHSYKNGVCTRCGALSGFNDVFENDWFSNDVKYVVNKKLMNGTGNEMFSPGGKTTRGQTVTILYRLAGSPSVSGDGFSDVKSSDWFYKAVQWASKNGIVSGYGNGKFGPNDPLNREQLATMLYRYAQFKKRNMTSTGGLSKFSDSGSINGYAIDAMSWAVSKGLISGTSDGKLNPGTTATRAQLAAILHRFCENVK